MERNRSISATKINQLYNLHGDLHCASKLLDEWTDVGLAEARRRLRKESDYLAALLKEHQQLIRAIEDRRSQELFAALLDEIGLEPFIRNEVVELCREVGLHPYLVGRDEEAGVIITLSENRGLNKHGIK